MSDAISDKNDARAQKNNTATIVNWTHLCQVNRTKWAKSKRTY